MTLGFATVDPALVQGANNPAFRVSVKVTVSARWVAHPSRQNLPPYFAADLKNIILGAPISAPRNAALESEVQEALSKRLKVMQSGSPAEFKAAGIPVNTVGDWIIVPEKTSTDAFPAGALLQSLLSYKGQPFQLPQPRKGTSDTPVSLQLPATMLISQIQNIHITVNQPAGGTPQPATFKLEQVSKRISEAVPEGGIDIDVYQFASACEHPSKSEAAQRTATVVAGLYEQLYALGLTLNSFVPTSSEQYNQAIQTWANAFVGSSSGPRVKAQWTTATGELQITNLPTVQDVTLHIAAGSGGDFSSLEERLHSRACDQLVGLPLTPRGQVMFQYLAKQDPGVKDAVPDYQNGNLLLTITPQPTLARLIASGGFSYNNGTGWTGKLTATGQDLIWNEKLYYLSNTLQAAYQGGGSYQNASLSASVTKPSRDPLSRPEFYSVVIGGNFLQNQNQRYGGQLPGQTLTVSETQATAGLKLSYDSFSIFDESDALNVAPPTRKLNRNQIVLPIGFMFERFSAFGNQGAFRSAGDILQFSVAPDYQYSHDFESTGKTKGWSELDVEATADYIKGVSAGGYIGFDRYLGTVTLTAYLGLRSTRQFLLRAAYGAGSLSAGGPIVRVFQLGGSQWVPGLQLGEFSGQTLASGQGEFGIDIPSVLRLFRRNVKDLKLFDIRRSYLKFDYARAAVSQRESVPAVASLSPGAESYGPAVEIGRLQNVFDLTAGYMYSPQSAVHTHGTFLLTVHVNDIRQR